MSRGLTLLTALASLSLGGNPFSNSTLPSGFGALTRLTALNAPLAQLSGTLHTTLSALTVRCRVPG